MTAPKKRALVEALEALIPYVEGRREQAESSARRRGFGGYADMQSSPDISHDIATARALVEAYRKEKGEG